MLSQIIHLSPLFKSTNLETHWMYPLTVVTTDVVVLGTSMTSSSTNMGVLGSDWLTMWVVR